MSELMPSPREPTAPAAADPPTNPAPELETLRLAAGKQKPESVVPPPQLPGYEMLGELGRGGMGIVYKARQRSLDRLVAIKMLRDSALAGADQLLRLRSEAAAVARLQHPSIVQIHDLSEHQGLPFYVMEYVAGGNLSQRLDNKPMPARDAAELVETLARAVHYAHQQGIIHRDLKPGNILLGTCADTRTPACPKISDFGLAKRLDLAVSGATPSSALMGTPSYMAPEQASGTKELGPPADIYALGAILYECLTGKPPFESDSVLRTLDLVRFQDPTPPSQHNPGVPADLETVCLRCLRKDPTHRYATAAALAEDLQRFLAGRPLAADVPDAGSDSVTVPGYEVWEELSRGGIWIVYKARDTRAKRLVALKRIRPGATLDPQNQTRLRAVVELARKLEHPQIATLYDMGGVGDRQYLAFELVEGGSLARAVRGQRLAPLDAARLVELLADAVQHAHKQGLIHCHLQMTNVLLAPVAEDAKLSPVETRLGTPKIIGYELARRRQDTSAAEDLDSIRPCCTAMAPELLFGKQEQIGPATDVYALGIILYELLTAVPPFEAATTSDLLLKVGFERLAPPRKHHPEVPRGLERICMKCLEKDPKERYESADQLAADLRLFQQGVPSSLEPKTWWQRVLRWLRKFRPR